MAVLLLLPPTLGLFRTSAEDLYLLQVFGTLLVLLLAVAASILASVVSTRPPNSARAIGSISRHLPCASCIEEAPTLPISAHSGTLSSSLRSSACFRHPFGDYCTVQKRSSRSIYNLRQQICCCHPQASPPNYCGRCAPPSNASSFSASTESVASCRWTTLSYISECMPNTPWPSPGSISPNPPDLQLWWYE